MSGTTECSCGKTISANKKTCSGCVDKPTGVLEILNVQGGDVKISFDKADAQEVIRAKRIVTDMLRRGYALLVEVERKGERAYERVKGFDEAAGEYIIADLDPVQAAATVDDPKLKPGQAALCDCGRPARHRGRCKGKPSGKRIPMNRTKALAIPMSSGG